LANFQFAGKHQPLPSQFGQLANFEQKIAHCVIRLINLRAKATAILPKWYCVATFNVGGIKSGQATSTNGQYCTIASGREQFRQNRDRLTKRVWFQPG
jgi:hypothetical protein